MRAVIDADRDVFTLINTFEVEPEKAAAVVQSLRDFTERVTRNSAGFISASVHIGLDRTRVVNYVQWRSEEDLRAMIGEAEFQAHLREVLALALRITPVFYKVEFVRT